VGLNVQKQHNNDDQYENVMLDVRVEYIIIIKTCDHVTTKHQANNVSDCCYNLKLLTQIKTNNNCAIALQDEIKIK